MNIPTVVEGVVMGVGVAGTAVYAWTMLAAKRAEGLRAANKYSDEEADRLIDLLTGQNKALEDKVDALTGKVDMLVSFIAAYTCQTAPACENRQALPSSHQKSEFEILLEGLAT